MSLQKITILYNGRWKEKKQYVDFELCLLDVPCDCNFEQLNDCVRKKLSFGPNQFVSRITMYMNDSNKSNMIRIMEDKDVFCLMVCVPTFLLWLILVSLIVWTIQITRLPSLIVEKNSILLKHLMLMPCHLILH